MRFGRVFSFEAECYMIVGIEDTFLELGEVLLFLLEGYSVLRYEVGGREYRVGRRC